MSKVAVYCGASMPKSESLHFFATDIGTDLARLGHSVIYGGSNKGLMGRVAAGALSMYGDVIGLTVPALSSKEPLLEGITNIECHSLPDRLLKFRELADIHLILPGGTGTLEELASAINAMCFNSYGIDIEENMPPCPIYLADDPEGLNSRLFAYLESLVEEGLLNAEVFKNVQLKSWPAIMASLPKQRTLMRAS